MKTIKLYSSRIADVLIQASLDPQLIEEFLESQIEVFKKVNLFNKETSTESFIRNEIKITQVSILKELLDNDYPKEYDETFLASKERVTQQRSEIKQALVDSGLKPEIILEFLEEQIEVFVEVWDDKRKEFSKDDQRRDELKLQHVTLMRNALRYSPVL